MPVANSPLRYPGGKSVLADFLASVIDANDLQDGTYVEPYAGGAGAALSLLFGEHVQQVVLNDADPCVYAFWNAILNDRDEFVRRIWDTPISIEEWKRQRDIYRARQCHSQMEIAFAGFYLNRCNRSGIMVNGGPIGGFMQTGEWKLDARYNKVELVRRIEKIHAYRDRIEAHNRDAIDFLKDSVLRRKDCDVMLVYLDPPYFEKGRDLYLNYYGAEDHAELATFIRQQKDFRWLISYDDVPEIRLLYQGYHVVPFRLDYSAYMRRKGREVLIHGSDLVTPREAIPGEVTAHVVVTD